MPTPSAALRAGILKPRGIDAGKAEDENIVPPVAVEIVDEGEEVIGVAQRIPRNGGVNVVANFEVGPLPPIRAGDGVEFTIVVEIAEGGALAEKLIVERKLAVGGCGGIGREAGGDEGEGGEGGE